MEDLEALAAHRRAIEHLIPLLEAIRSVAEIAWRRAANAAGPLARYDATLLPSVVRSLARLDPEVRRELLESPADGLPTGLLIVGSERGLCGPFNDHLVAEGLRRAGELEADGEAVRLLCLGGRVRRLLEAAARPVLYSQALPSFSVPSYVYSEEVALDLLEQIERRAVGRLVVLSNAPAGRFHYRAVLRPLVPPELTTDHALAADVEVKPDGDEPTLAAHLLTEHLLVGLHRIVIESAISEQLARISAMRLATENARRVLDHLTLEYTAAQQQAVTASILEVVAGYELTRAHETESSM